MKTKLKLLILASALSLVFTGCNQNAQPAEPTKEAKITINMEDNKQFNENEFVAPTITVEPSSLAKTIKYYAGQEEIGTTPRQTYGDYTMVVTTEKTSEYKATTASKSFMIRKVPTITFTYGDNQPMEDGQKFTEGEDYTIVAHSSVEGAQFTYSYSTATAELSAKPTEPGVYWLTASVARTSVIGQAEASIQFEIESAVQQPTITFYYNEVAVDTSENHWIGEGYGDSQYYPNEFQLSKLTFLVNPEMEVTRSWTLNEAPIEQPTEPLKAGTYALTVAVVGHEDWVNWVLFAIKEASDPVVSFKYNDVAVDTSSNHWIGEGYGDSQYFANEFDVTKLTYTVTPEVACTVSWTRDDVAIDAPTNPLPAGTYAMRVQPNGYAETSANWVLFAIKEASDPVVSFKYNDVAVDTSSNHWIGEGYGDSKYLPDEFDLAKLTYTVTPEVACTVSWTLDETPIDAPTAPLAVGTYAMTVQPTGYPESCSNYVLFAIVASK